MTLKIPVKKFTKKVYGNSIKAAMVYGGQWKKKDEMYPFQVDMSYNVLQGVLKRVSSSYYWYLARKSGKTFSAGALAKTLLEMPAWIGTSEDPLWFKHGFNIACFGPNLQKSAIIFEDAEMIYRSHYS